MDDGEHVSAILGDLTQLLLHDYPLRDVLRTLCYDIAELLSVAGAAVLRSDAQNQLIVTAISGEAGEGLTDEHERGHHGHCLAPSPCLDACSAASGAPVVVADLRGTAQWPAFSEKVLAHGIVAVTVFPMQVRGECLGALCVYHTAPRSATPVELSTVALVADAAAACVTTTEDLQHARRIARQFETALDSRVVVEQAKGFVAARLGLPVAGAFDLLRAYARRRGHKLREVAGGVLSGQLDAAELTFDDAEGR